MHQAADRRSHAGTLASSLRAVLDTITTAATSVRAALRTNRLSPLDGMRLTDQLERELAEREFRNRRW